jgi:hypothetical protein
VRHGRQAAATGAQRSCAGRTHTRGTHAP